MAEKAHTPTADCWCKPKVIESPNQLTIIHKREAKSDPRKTD
jgi:hypothetical protein